MRGKSLLLFFPLCLVVLAEGSSLREQRVMSGRVLVIPEPDELVELGLEAPGAAVGVEKNQTTVERAEGAANAYATKALALLDSVPGGHLSVAMRSVLMLMAIFFVIQTLIKVIETKMELSSLAAQMQAAPDVTNASGASTAYGDDLEYDQDKQISGIKKLFQGFFSFTNMQSISGSMSVLPMLSILIVFARIRASMDLHTAPQAYARGFFITTALCVYVQAIAVVAFPKSGSGVCYWIGKVLDWVATLVLYLGIICIIASICTLERCAEPENKDHSYFCGLDQKDLTKQLNAMPPAQGTRNPESF